MVLCKRLILSYLFLYHVVVVVVSNAVCGYHDKMESTFVCTPEIPRAIFIRENV